MHKIPANRPSRCQRPTGYTRCSPASSAIDLGLPSNLARDGIHGRNPLQRLAGKWRSLVFVDIVKFAAGVSPARGFLNGGRDIQLGKTGIAVSLQDPAEALEMSARMLTFLRSAE